MRLTLKMILIIIVTVTAIISGMFYIIAIRFDNQIEKQLLSTVRAVYNNIVLTRQWVSDHEGVFILKKPGDQTNPFLLHPELLTETGDTLALRNPALVTRELSELSNLTGQEITFHLTSLNYVNPANKPDEFEERALIFFMDSVKLKKSFEFYQNEKIENKTFFRYFAPLYTEESCLSCHSRHGYELGDLRGGISILMPADEYVKAKREHLFFLISTALLTILALSIPIFLAIKRSVIKPLSSIADAAQRIREGDYDFNLTIQNKKDEIGYLAHTFENMRKKIREYTNQLKISENKYRQLSEHSFDAVAIVAQSGNIIDCNAKLSHLTGYDRDTLKTLNFADLLNSDLKTMLTAGTDKKVEAEHFETILLAKDDLNFPVEIYSLKGFSLGDFKNLSFIYVRDLSERKKIEEYSIQTEKMYALGQISAGIAHEIRNPLFALNNNLDYLYDKLKDNEDLDEIYADSRNGIERIQNLVSAILDYARPHELEFKDVSIEEIIMASLALVQKQFENSSIRIEAEFQPNLNAIHADPHKLEQVFLNLFLNAFQAMSNSGRLGITVRPKNDHLSVCIEDTGKGIPAEDLNRVFDPFYSKTAHGTGLGMAIVQRILEQHKAHFWIQSEETIGTQFNILFHYE